MLKCVRIEIGVRPQAIGVLALSGLFYLSFFLGLVIGGKSSVGALGFGCGLISVLTLFIAPFLGVVLLLSHLRAGRPYKTLVCCAIAAAFSPWVLFLLFVFFSQSHVRFERIDGPPDKLMERGRF